jgi:2-dehydropantoate 2-reductase
VGRAEAPALAEGIVDNLLNFFGASDAAIRGSMYYDLAAGRRLEIETLNGTVVRLGREHGIPTPANFVVYASLKPYAEGPPTGTAPAA